MINIYCVGDVVQTPIHNAHFVERLQTLVPVRIVGKPSEADVFFARKLKRLAVYRMLYPGKRFFCWTNEPRWDLSQRAVVPRSWWRAGARVMNLYTGDVYWHNLHFFGTYHYDPSFNPSTMLDAPLRPTSVAEFDARKNKAIAVLTCRDRENTRVMWQGRNVDLEQLRASIARYGHSIGQCDIAGKKWPAGMTLEDTRDDGDWCQRKVSLLQGYRFAFCLENTCLPYYCTEKLWQGVVAHTLPIYVGQGTRIFETFPRGSFVDLSDFEDPREVYAYLQGLSSQQCVDRINACVEVYNREREKRIGHLDDDFQAVLQRIAGYLQGADPT